MTSHQIQLYVDRTGAGINWRLLAANHRETGRGTRLYGTEIACRDDVRRLQSNAGRLVPRTRREPLGRWSWELSLDGVIVLTSTNSFDRLIRCEQILAGLAQRFAAAGIADVVVNPAGRRRDPVRPELLREYA